MKKQLPTEVIENELSGASAFFQRQAPPSQPQPVTENPTEAQPVIPPPNLPTKQAPKKPPVVDTTTARKNDTLTPRHHDTVIPSIIETVRKAVRQIGKEAATHRFTQEEKQALADIIYTYGRRGYKTSENEIPRVAINWLVLDYKEHGEESVLAKVLYALND